MTKNKRFFKIMYDYDWWFVFDKKQEYVETECPVPHKEASDLIPMTEEQVVELLNENEQLKIQIKIFEMFLKENNLDIDWISFCGLDHLCIANNNDFECQYCPCLEFKGCFDD